MDRVVTSGTSAAPSCRLPDGEVARRAARVKLVLTDCDGVLTDNGVYYGAEGEALKRFSIRDGMGVERLRNAGIATAIITGENAHMVLRRAEKLRIHVHLGIKDKGAALPAILALGPHPHLPTADNMAHPELSLDEVAYIGDDVNDLPAMALLEAHGLVGAPADAMPEVARTVHYVTVARGGFGAFREFAEWILSARA